MNNPSSERPQWLVPPLLALGAAGGLLWLRRRRRTRRVTIATYNVQAYTIQLDPLLHVMDDLDTDIIVIQELSVPLAERIRTELSEEYPYQALNPDYNNATRGQGLLSRYPIIDSEYWQHTMGFQRVVIQVGDMRLTVFNAHPATPLTTSYEQRAYEIRDLMERAGAIMGPIVLLGDFNMEEWSDDYRRITERYEDAYARVGRNRRFTFPNSLAGLPVISLLVRPLMRLDYIFHNEAVHSRKVLVWPDSGGSDHLPLRATLVLRR